MNRLAALALLATVTPALPLAAQEFPAEQETPAQDWSGQVTLSAWGAGMGGELTPFTGGPAIAFDKALGELL